MGQKSLKNYRRALKRTAQEEKEHIISDYVKNNYDTVLVSSVKMIRRFNFKNRFQIAMTILFKPEKPKKVKAAKPGKNKPTKLPVHEAEANTSPA